MKIFTQSANCKRSMISAYGIVFTFQKDIKNQKKQIKLLLQE